jgi:integrase
MECFRLRVKDLDFDRKILIVREGKGRKDRAVMLPEPLNIPLRHQLETFARALGGGSRPPSPGVAMPDALARKYPRAAERWAWLKKSGSAAGARLVRYRQRLIAIPACRLV